MQHLDAVAAAKIHPQQMRDRAHAPTGEDQLSGPALGRCHQLIHALPFRVGCEEIQRLAEQRDMGEIGIRVEARVAIGELRHGKGDIGGQEQRRAIGPGAGGVAGSDRGASARAVLIHIGAAAEIFGEAIGQDAAGHLLPGAGRIGQHDGNRAAFGEALGLGQPRQGEGAAQQRAAGEGHGLGFPRDRSQPMSCRHGHAAIRRCCPAAPRGRAAKRAHGWRPAAPGLPFARR